MNKKKRRALCLLCSAGILVGSVMGAYKDAYASSIVIGGGTVAVGEAVAYLLGVFGLAAASAAVYQSKDALKEWGNDMLDDFQSIDWNLESHKVDPTTQELLDWIDDVAKGTIDTSSKCWTAFKEWCDMLRNDAESGAGNAEGSITSGEHAIYDGYSVFTNIGFNNAIGGREYVYTQSVDVYTCFSYGSTGKSCYAFYASTGPFKIRTVNANGTASVNSGGTYAQTMKIDGVTHTYYGVMSSGNAYGNEADEKYGLLSGVVYSPYGLQLKDFVQDFVLNPDAEVTYPVEGEAVTTVIDVGLEDVWERDGTYENVTVVGVDSIPGTVEVPIDWTKVGTIVEVLEGMLTGVTDIGETLTGAGVIVVDGVTGNVVDDTGVTDVPVDDVISYPLTPPADMESYTLAGLEKLFPFCLPFDLIDFLNVLSAEPEAPYFEIPIPYPAPGGMKEYTVVIDFSQFDGVAAILRNMECLAFIVGLCVLTRDKMIRG